MKIALIQQKYYDTKKQTIKKTVNMIKKASQNKAELIVLQELHQTNYFCQNEDIDNFDFIFEHKLPSLKAKKVYLHYLDGNLLTIADFFKSVKSCGFLVTKKLIIIRDIFDNKKLKNIQDEIIKFLKTQKDDPEENYLIFWQTGKTDARSKLYKALKGVRT